MPSLPKESIVRRRPFSDNPVVGPRGLRTQQRIVDAALEVFAADGYHRSSVDRITTLAGCSRVAFYQYFSSKEDLFRELAGQVARQLVASVETLEPLTGGREGWSAIRSWVARYSDIYDRYEAIFRAIPIAVESDAALAGGSTRAGQRTVALFQSKLPRTSVPARLLDCVVDLLLGMATKTLDIASIMRTAAPEPWVATRVNDALADVVHRSLFLPRHLLNVRPAPFPEPPPLALGSATLGLLEQTEPTASGPLAALLDTGPEVFVRHGYHSTRVDDLVAAAGISHGAFYRYFENKDDFVRVLAARSLRSVTTVLAEVPRLLERGRTVDRTALRRWLERYGTQHAEQVALIRVWVEAGLADDTLRADSAAIFDWGRRRMRSALKGRRLGDVEAEALVMLALVEAFGARPPTTSQIDAAVHIVEKGLVYPSISAS